MLTANPFGGPGVSWITRRVSYRPRGVHRFKNVGQTTSGVKCVDVEYMGWGKLYRPIGSSNESTDDQFGIRFRELKLHAYRTSSYKLTGSASMWEMPSGKSWVDIFTPVQPMATPLDLPPPFLTQALPELWSPAPNHAARLGGWITCLSMFVTKIDFERIELHFRPVLGLYHSVASRRDGAKWGKWMEGDDRGEGKGPGPAWSQLEKLYHLVGRHSTTTVRMNAGTRGPLWWPSTDHRSVSFHTVAASIGLTRSDATVRFS